jgi:hypothetical protein
MKSVLVGLGLLFAVSGCSINHKSDAYACTKQSECSNGRTCSPEGFCVVSGSGIDAPRLDAPKGDGGGNCPAGCTSCNVSQKTCTIDCSLTSCAAQINCPAGYHCDVQCKGDNTCRGGVSCVGALSCTVECTGQTSCRNVQCGNGPCDVMCSGQNSCRDVFCNASCACDVTCTGQQACTAGTLMCTSTACRQTIGLGCTSVPALCHSCM